MAVIKKGRYEFDLNKIQNYDYAAIKVINNVGEIIQWPGSMRVPIRFTIEKSYNFIDLPIFEYMTIGIDTDNNKVSKIICIFPSPRAENLDFSEGYNLLSNFNWIFLETPVIEILEDYDSTGDTGNHREEFVNWFNACTNLLLPLYLSGTWQFFPKITFGYYYTDSTLNEIHKSLDNSIIEQKISFIAKDEESIINTYQSMSWEFKKGTYFYGYLKYGDTQINFSNDNQGSGGTLPNSYEWTFLYSPSRTISFTKKQQVSSRFFQWFTSNAYCLDQYQNAWIANHNPSGFNRDQKNWFYGSCIYYGSRGSKIFDTENLKRIDYYNSRLESSDINPPNYEYIEADDHLIGMAEEYGNSDWKGRDFNWLSWGHRVFSFDTNQLKLNDIAEPGFMQLLGTWIPLKQLDNILFFNLETYKDNFKWPTNCNLPYYYYKEVTDPDGWTFYESFPPEAKDGYVFIPMNFRNSDLQGIEEEFQGIAIYDAYLSLNGYEPYGDVYQIYFMKKIAGNRWERYPLYEHYYDIDNFPQLRFIRDNKIILQNLTDQIVPEPVYDWFQENIKKLNSPILQCDDNFNFRITDGENNESTSWTLFYQGELDSDSIVLSEGRDFVNGANYTLTMEDIQTITASGEGQNISFFAKVYKEGYGPGESNIISVYSVQKPEFELNNNSGILTFNLDTNENIDHTITFQQQGADSLLEITDLLENNQLSLLNENLGIIENNTYIITVTSKLSSTDLQFPNSNYYTHKTQKLSRIVINTKYTALNKEEETILFQWNSDTSGMPIEISYIKTNAGSTEIVQNFITTYGTTYSFSNMIPAQYEFSLQRKGNGWKYFDSDITTYVIKEWLPMPILAQDRKQQLVQWAPIGNTTSYRVTIDNKPLLDSALLSYNETQNLWLLNLQDYQDMPYLIGVIGMAEGHEDSGIARITYTYRLPLAHFNSTYNFVGNAENYEYKIPYLNGDQYQLLTEGKFHQSNIVLDWSQNNSQLVFSGGPDYKNNYICKIPTKECYGSITLNTAGTNTNKNIILKPTNYFNYFNQEVEYEYINRKYTYITSVFIPVADNDIIRVNKQGLKIALFGEDKALIDTYSIEANDKEEFSYAIVSNDIDIFYIRIILSDYDAETNNYNDLIITRNEEIID